MRLRKGIPSNGHRNTLVARLDAVKNANFSTSMPFIPPRRYKHKNDRRRRTILTSSMYPFHTSYRTVCCCLAEIMSNALGLKVQLMMTLK